MTAAILQWPDFTPSKTDRNNWIVTSPLRVRVKNGAVLTLLAGFESDGESGPEGLKGLLMEKDTRRLIAAMLHDALYQAQLLREWADSIYREVLELTGVSDETRVLLYTAVRDFGGSSYTADGRDPVKVAAATSHLRIELLEAA